MRVDLVYYHSNGEITLSFSFSTDEKAVAVGLGETREEAMKKIYWCRKDSEEIKNQERFKYPKDKPFMIILKKTNDGKIVKADQCINVLKGKPTGKNNQITIRTIIL